MYINNWNILIHLVVVRKSVWIWLLLPIFSLWKNLNFLHVNDNKRWLKPYTSSYAIQIIGKWKKQKVYWVQLPKIACFSPQIRLFGGVSKQNGQTFDDVTKCHGLEVYRGIGKCISFNLELFWPYGSIWNYEKWALKVPRCQAKLPS